MAELFCKRNDLARRIEDTLTLDGIAINLADATVKFLLHNTALQTLLEGPATIIDAAAGKVAFSFSETQTSVEGIYLFEWEITFLNGRKLTVPDDSYHTLTIIKDLG